MATETLSKRTEAEAGPCYDMWNTARIATIDREPPPLPPTRFYADFNKIEPLILDDGNINYIVVMLYHDNEKSKCIIRGYHRPGNDYTNEVGMDRYHPDGYVLAKLLKELEDYNVHYMPFGWGHMNVDRVNKTVSVVNVSINPGDFRLKMCRKAHKMGKMLEAWKVKTGLPTDEEPAKEDPDSGPPQQDFVIRLDFVPAPYESGSDVIEDQLQSDVTEDQPHSDVIEYQAAKEDPDSGSNPDDFIANLNSAPAPEESSTDVIEDQADASGYGIIQPLKID